MWFKNPFDEVESVSDNVYEVYRLRTVDEWHREGAYSRNRGKKEELKKKNRVLLSKRCLAILATLSPTMRRDRDKRRVSSTRR